jgi:hypothetical protein
MEYLGTWGTLIHEKNLMSKSRHTPFNKFVWTRKRGAEAFREFREFCEVFFGVPENPRLHLTCYDCSAPAVGAIIPVAFLRKMHLLVCLKKVAEKCS